MSIKIDYVEFESAVYDQTRSFFSQAFGWTYKEFGPEYCEIQEAGLASGIAAIEKPVAPLVILKTDDLEAALEKVKDAGGEITQEIFSFPGGRRFHFKEPGGSDLAIWEESAQG